jgi:hypothetical protein
VLLGIEFRLWSFQVHHGPSCTLFSGGGTNGSASLP